jgi:transcriptional regulator with XRE-family HTH domain
VNSKAFGQNVHRRRMAMNMTQEQFSEAISVSRTYLQSIEAGSANPTLKVAGEIVRVCKCSWNELMRGTD